jgi:uncharacterized membrane protein YfcA
VSWSLQTAVVLGLLGVGAFGTLIGAGGGFILTPILLLLYPHDSAQALTAISLTAVVFNAASGSAAYARQRRIDFRSGTIFALATLPGAIGGALVVGIVTRHVFDAIMAEVLALLATWLLLGERWPLPPRGLISSDGCSSTEQRDVRLRRPAASRCALQPRRRVRFELPRDRWRCHPRAAARARARLPDPHRDRDLTLRTRDHGRRRHADPMSCSAASCVVLGAQLGAHVSLRLRGRAIQQLLAAALLALALRLPIAV